MVSMCFKLGIIYILFFNFYNKSREREVDHKEEGEGSGDGEREIRGSSFISGSTNELSSFDSIFKLFFLFILLPAIGGVIIVIIALCIILYTELIRL